MLNRELRFRVWDLTQEENPGGPQMVYVEFGDGFSGMLDCPIMQYTGLKDKNGKDLYEGDVVKREGHIYSIEFGRGCFFLRINGDRRLTSMEMVEQFNKSRIIGHYAEQVEILGNIHEHPHPLK